MDVYGLGPVELVIAFVVAVSAIVAGVAWRARR